MRWTSHAQPDSATAGLSVDTESLTGALRLYERLGFYPVKRLAIGVKTIRAAGAPASAPDDGHDGRSVAVAPTAGPLAGLVVCDLSTVLAGPYCTMLLADLGADVIKVEPPDGDGTRGWGPPFAGAPEPGAAYAAGDPRADPTYAGESAYYLAINRNKRGLRLDLKQAQGREVLARLLARSDVLVENFRVGGLARLGFPDDELDRLNPRLVHLAISGYGTDGPLADRPGYDFIIQAAAGLMSITGESDASGGEPTKVGVAISDLSTGMLGAVAVLAAVSGRDRPGSPTYGRGQRIDLSLLESTVAWLANQASNHLVGGTVPGRMGNQHPNITPYETFPTADGVIAVAVGSERQWQRFCEAIGRPTLADDPRFADNAARLAHRAELREILVAVFTAAPSAVVAGQARSSRGAERPDQRPGRRLQRPAGPGASDGRDRRASDHRAGPSHGRALQAGRPPREPCAPHRHCSGSTPTRCWPGWAMTRAESVALRQAKVV